MSCTVIIKDKNLKPENIKKGVTILKVTGTLDASGGGSAVLQDKTVDSSTVLQSVLPGTGYDGLSRVTVNPYTLDSKTVNSSTSQQVVTSSANGLSSVTVEPYELDSKTVDPSTSQQTVNSSVDGLSSVTVTAVTSSIDANISAGNIKKDVTILGVTGTYEPAPVQPTLQDASLSYNQNGLYTVNASSGYDGLGTVDISINIPSQGSDWVIKARLGETGYADLSNYDITANTSRGYGAAGILMHAPITKIPRIFPASHSGAGQYEAVAMYGLMQAFEGCSNLQDIDVSTYGSGYISSQGMYKTFVNCGELRDVSICIGGVDNTAANIMQEIFSQCSNLRNVYISFPANTVVGNYWFTDAFSNISRTNDTVITIEGISEVGTGSFQTCCAWSKMWNGSGGFIFNLPDNLNISGFSSFAQAFASTHFVNGAAPSFIGKLNTITAGSAFDSALDESDVSTAAIGFNSINGDGNFGYTYRNCHYLTTVTFDGSFSITGSGNFVDTFAGSENLTTIICSSAAGTMPFRDAQNGEGNGNNAAETATVLENLTIDHVNSDIYLNNSPNLSRDSVYEILTKAAGATIQQGDNRVIVFSQSGLVVEDYQDGRIQTAYDAAVNDGWTVSNLTITPYS